MTTRNHRREKNCRNVSPQYFAQFQGGQVPYSRFTSPHLFPLVYFEPTMDPNTAYRHVQLSDGGQKATLKAENLNPPNHLDRFQFWRQVLCREPLAGSPYYWEVEWKGQKVQILYISIPKFKKQSINVQWGIDFSCSVPSNRFLLGCATKTWNVRVLMSEAVQDIMSSLGVCTGLGLASPFGTMGRKSSWAHLRPNGLVCTWTNTLGFQLFTASLTSRRTSSTPTTPSSLVHSIQDSDFGQSQGPQ